MRWQAAGALVLLSAVFSTLAQDNPDAPDDLSVVTKAKENLGSWIWDAKTFDKQTCRLWKSFVIPREKKVSLATLDMTADNGYSVFLDGREIGRGSDFHALTEYDVTLLLNPGTHVLAVEAFNEKFQAGLILGLQIEFTDGSKTNIVSDTSWRIVPNGESRWLNKINPAPGWPSAVDEGAVGSPPWGRRPSFLVVQPQTQPLVVHLWETFWFQATLFCFSILVVLLCLRLLMQLSVQAKAQQLLQLERARIAQDIHDDLGARLTQLVLRGEVAQHALADDSPARREITGICDDARDLSNVVDEVVWVVNSRRDTLFDFAGHVCNYAQSFLRSTPIRCRFDVEPELPEITFGLFIRRNLLLAVKEALNNAAKHSEATELILRIHHHEKSLQVIIEDNGKGFDPSQAGPEGNGLTNMVRRMNDMGGQCRVISQPGGGCLVQFDVPLAHTKEDSWWLNLMFRPQRLPAELSEKSEPAGQMDVSETSEK